MPPRVLLPLGTRAKNQLFLLWAKSLQAAHAPIAARGFELVHGLDTQLDVQQCNGLRADTLKMQKVEDRGRELLEQFPVIARLAGFGNYANLRGEISADARNSAKLLLGQIGELVCRVSECFRRVPVRANLEWVLALD